MVAVTVGSEVSDLVDNDMPEGCVATIGLNHVNMRLHFGNSEEAASLFGIKLRIDELPDIPIGTATISAAGQSRPYLERYRTHR